MPCGLGPMAHRHDRRIYRRGENPFIRRGFADNGASPEQRLVIRSGTSKPLVFALEAWLREQRDRISAKSKIAKASTTVWTSGPLSLAFSPTDRTCISDNAAERAARGVATKFCSRPMAAPRASASTQSKKKPHLGWRGWFGLKADFPTVLEVTATTGAAGRKTLLAAGQHNRDDALCSAAFRTAAGLAAKVIFRWSRSGKGPMAVKRRQICRR